MSLTVAMSLESIAAVARGRRMAREGRGLRIRRELGLSLAEVADLLGVSPSALSRWERQQRLPRGPQAIRYQAVVLALEERGEAL